MEPGKILGQSVKIIALVSILMGLAVASVSSLMLHRAIVLERSPTRRTAEDLLSQVNVFFGGMLGIYDLNVIFNILQGCSATALVGGFVQFIMSFWLLLVSMQRSGKAKLVWIVAHIIILVAILGSFLCILTTELQVNIAVKIFLPITGIDSLLIILSLFIVGTAGEEAGGNYNNRSFNEESFPGTKPSGRGNYGSGSENDMFKRDRRLEQTEKVERTSPEEKKPPTPRMESPAKIQSFSDLGPFVVSNELRRTTKDVHYPIPKRDTVGQQETRETDF